MQPGMPSFTSRPEDFSLKTWVDHLKTSSKPTTGSSPASTEEISSESTSNTARTATKTQTASNAQQDVIPSESVPIGLIANMSLSEAGIPGAKTDKNNGEEGMVSYDPMRAFYL